MTITTTGCAGCSGPKPKKARFCGRACWRRWKMGKDAHGKIVHAEARQRACERCARPFVPALASVRHGMGRFCSRACSGAAKRRGADTDYTIRMSWYLSRGWGPLSERLRANACCEICNVRDTPLNVHHKKDPFPTRDIDLLLARGNLIVSCVTCHRRQHQRGAHTACETCGKDVRHAPSRSGKLRFCSMTCRDKHPDFARMLPRICTECGTSFQPAHPASLRCSAACAAKHVGRKKLAARPAFTCPQCSKSFTLPPSQAARPRAKPPCCSMSCARRQ